MLRMPKLEFIVQWEKQTLKQTNFKLVLSGRKREHRVGGGGCRSREILMFILKSAVLPVTSVHARS